MTRTVEVKLGGPLRRAAKFAGGVLSRRAAVIGLLCGLVVPAASSAAAADAGNAKPLWLKGQTHAHSFWSDGDEFPEMAADWYKSHGYHFFALSDHNVLMEGERWVAANREKNPIPPEVIAKCRERFGNDWVETRGEGDALQVRLKTFEEIRKRLEEPGKFILIQGEEITGKFDEKQVHVNAINLAGLIEPKQGTSVADTLRLNLLAVEEQAKASGRMILAHVNHPNWKEYDIPPDVVARTTEARFLEVCNNNDEVNHYGDEHHPGMERFWDIANTIRIAELKSRPLYGVGSDDAHHYHQLGPEQANPGRAWIMVRATQLTPEAILQAISRGDFYATTGVVLRKLTYDRENGLLDVAVRAEPNVKYTIEFTGTLADYDRTTETVQLVDKEGKPAGSTIRYSQDLGKTFAATEATRATYKLSGNELFVRAVVRSDKPLANPPAKAVEREEAWCQPVGWEKWTAKAGR